MTDIVHMRNDVIEGITKNLQVKFEYKAGGEYGSDSPKVITNRTVTPTKFYSDFTGFTGYDTDKQEDRNFRFERVQKWKGLYGNEIEVKIAMERKRRFPLTKEQYKLWEHFVTDNYETIYSNKDTHEVKHTPNSPRYTVTVERTEQSGMQNFLENLLAI